MEPERRVLRFGSDGRCVVGDSALLVNQNQVKVSPISAATRASLDTSRHPGSLGNVEGALGCIAISVVVVLLCRLLYQSGDDSDGLQVESLALEQPPPNPLGRV